MGGGGEAGGKGHCSGYVGCQQGVLLHGERGEGGGGSLMGECWGLGEAGGEGHCRCGLSTGGVDTWWEGDGGGR